jgi:drug/metabolite transporter (DMT)-like permease
MEPVVARVSIQKGRLLQVDAILAKEDAVVASRRRRLWARVAGVGLSVGGLFLVARAATLDGLKEGDNYTGYLEASEPDEADELYADFEKDVVRSDLHRNLGVGSLVLGVASWVWGWVEKNRGIESSWSISAGPSSGSPGVPGGGVMAHIQGSFGEGEEQEE